MLRCVDCKRFFSERRFTGYSGLKLPPEKIVQIVNWLVEGISVRSTARLVDVEKKTTPAVAAGATDHVWTIEELLNTGAISP